MLQPLARMAMRLSRLHLRSRIPLRVLLVGLAACGTANTGPDPQDPALPPSGYGLNAELVPRALFPPESPWNQPVDGAPVDPQSDQLIASIGAWGYRTAKPLWTGAG